MNLGDLTTYAGFFLFVLFSEIPLTLSVWVFCPTLHVLASFIICDKQKLHKEVGDQLMMATAGVQALELIYRI